MTSWKSGVVCGMKFNEWLDTFIEEKGIDTEQILEAQGNSGTNYIPVGVLIEHIKLAPANEKERIKDTIVKIDYANGDVLHFFKHLAGAIAI